MTDVPLYRKAPPIAAVLGFAGCYIGLATLSISTALVQVNAAAVWLPSGFAVGLLMARGLRFWPAIALGSLVFNLVLNLAARQLASPATSLIVAAGVALGNTGEAVLGGLLAQRFSRGAGYMFRVRAAFAFMLLVAPLPPLISALAGVSASRLGGLTTQGSTSDVVLTWYIADYVGIMVFAGLTILVLQRSALERGLAVPSLARLGEAAALAICLGFVGQAICGFFLTGWIGDWLEAYMVIPLLLWACFRFGTVGGLLSIAVVTLIAAIGTLRGYTAFPSRSPWLALVYLQIFLGMLSVITIAISASLAELQDIRATLETRVRARTKGIERLLREREVFTVLVAHDLQSPLYGIRNALRAASKAVAGGGMEPAALTHAFDVVDQTCSTLATRISSLMSAGRDHIDPIGQDDRKPFVQILENIARAHHLSIGAPQSRLLYRGDRSLRISRADEVEHIVDTLIDNALKYAATTTPLEVSAFRHGLNVEIHVVDDGPGLSAAARKSLFRLNGGAHRDLESRGSGLGLYLASEKADELGGRLTYSPTQPHGATFRLVIPA